MAEQLKKLRRSIDKLDREIVNLVARRFSLGKEIARYKKSHDMPLVDKIREKNMWNARKSWAKKFFVDSNFINKLFALIIAESKKKQGKIFRKKARLQ